MPAIDLRSGASGRWLRILALAVLAALAVVALMISPPVVRLMLGLLPSVLQSRLFETFLGALAIAYGAARAFAWSRSGGRTRRLLDRLDLASASALRSRLPALLLAVDLVLLAGWAPHYLLWPWHRDTDTFAVLAQSWDAGVLPYRDIRAYNFPGAIYQHWALGKIFGWGMTWPFNLADAAGLFALGAVLYFWSRRRLGGPLPGLAVYFVYLTFYLWLNFALVGQRDWHASLGAVLAIMTLETWPGRTGRTISAALAALALVLRPHVVVFLPALIAAVLEGTGGRFQARKSEVVDRDHELAAVPDHVPEGEVSRGPAKGGRAVVEWLSELAVFTALLFVPLLLAGIAGDFARGLKLVAWGGPYNRHGPPRILSTFSVQLAEPRNQAVAGLLAAALIAGRGAARRLCATWALAVGGALCYRLAHPVQHFYLIHPWHLVGTIALAPSLAWIINGARWPAPRLLAALVLIAEASLGDPRFFDPAASLRALRSIVRGETLPARPPPGAEPWFDPESARSYSWEDYRATLRYLRGHTNRETLVANVLKEPPYPTINGPAGRLSPFQAESGICWLLFVDLDVEPEFAESLIQARDAVVVWIPSQFRRPSQLPLERLERVIRAHYRFETRLGQIEVWRRMEDD